MPFYFKKYESYVSKIQFHNYVQTLEKHTLEYLVLVHLFVKVPRTGDREVTLSVFESSCAW